MPSDSLVMEELGQGRKWLGPSSPRCAARAPPPGHCSSRVEGAWN